MQYALQPGKTKRGRSKHDCTLAPRLLWYIQEQCLTEIYLGHKLFDQVNNLYVSSIIYIVRVDDIGLEKMVAFSLDKF